MSQKLKKTILFVDYENIQKIDLSIIQKQDINIKIFVGQSQNKIPINLIQTTQKLGQRVEWIRIEGAGSNALDFHIAFYLGSLSKDIKEGNFFILSKDKGFDPLIKYINQSKINCRRIETLLPLATNNKQKDTLIPQNIDSIQKVIKNLSKIQKSKRPRTRKTLRQHVKSLLSQNKLSDREIDILLDTLFLQKNISEVSNHLTYNF